MTTPLIQIQNLNYRHPQADKLIFDNFSREMESGACHVLLGRSGCGKSTLLRLIAGLVKPQSGMITVDGGQENPAGWKQFLFQDYDCFPWLTVFENVMLGSGPPPYPTKDKVDMILERVGLAHAAHLYPRALSGGMRKRLGFARTLVRQPKLLLLDEPFASLDIALRREMYALLQELIMEHGTTVILVSHDLHEALLLGDHIYVLGGYPVQVTTHIVNPLQHPRTESILTHDFYSKAHTVLTNAILSVNR
jgi:ABC-type nitrate/sulfonate/bicarbonate transport system ATPase subunit